MTSHGDETRSDGAGPTTLERTDRPHTDQTRVAPLRRLADAIRAIIAGTPVPVLVIYLVTTAINTVLFAHGDLHWTINNSYSYLNGHVLDFYDHNLATSGESSYYPTIYLLFAVLLTPMRVLLGHGEDPGGYASSWDVLWLKGILLVVFWASAWVMSRITREILPNRPQARRTVQIAYLLSPLAAFSVGIFGQYDVFGVLVTLLGLLFYFRGDKWRFALLFGIAATFKFFPLIIFVPLLVLRYKRLKDIALLSLVAGSVLVLEALPYLGSAAFRERTLLGLAVGMTTDPGQRSLVTIAGAVLVLGCVALWRARPTPEMLAPIAIHAAALAYGIVIIAVAWHPQWFVILTPFYALALGFLRRPTVLLLWESAAFVGFIWYVVNRMPANVDVTMLMGGALRSRVDGPQLLLGSFYPAWAMDGLSALIVVIVLAPTFLYVLERLRAEPRGALDDRPVHGAVWYVRVLTVPLAFTLPAALAAWMPLETAREIDPAAGTYSMRAVPLCGAFEEPYGELNDDVVARQSLVMPDADILALSLPVGTYGRDLAGSVDLVLRDQSGQDVARTTVDLSDHADNARMYLDTSEHPRGSGTYTVEVSTQGVEPGAGIALWGSSGDCYPGDLDVTDMTPTGDLDLVLYTHR